jgi:hypothetical protein
MLGGVVGVLRRGFGGAVFIRGQQVLKPVAQGLHALAELASAVAEDVFDPAPADVLHQHRLLRRGGRPGFLFQPVDQFDGGDVVARLGDAASIFGDVARFYDEVLALDVRPGYAPSLVPRASGGCWRLSRFASSAGNSIRVALTVSSASRLACIVGSPY